MRNNDEIISDARDAVARFERRRDYYRSIGFGMNADDYDSFVKIVNELISIVPPEDNTVKET